MIREEILEDELATIVDELNYAASDELDFEPIKPRGGPVSTLVRRMRDARSNSILG